MFFFFVVLFKYVHHNYKNRRLEASMQSVELSDDEFTIGVLISERKSVHTFSVQTFYPSDHNSKSIQSLTRSAIREIKA